MVATVHGRVMALAPETGAQLWQHDLSCEVFVDLALAHYPSTGASSSPRGREAHSAEHEPSTKQSVQGVAAAPVVLVADRASTLHAFDACSGDIVGKVQHEQHGCASAAPRVVARARVAAWHSVGAVDRLATQLHSSSVLLVTDRGHVLAVDWATLTPVASLFTNGCESATPPLVQCVCKLAWPSFSGAAVGSGHFAVVGDRGDWASVLKHAL